MKRVLATILSLVMVLGTIVIFPVSAEEAITPDTSWYTEHTSDTEYTISTPAQLLGLSVLIQDFVTFSGKTIKLANDIDLNPGYTVGSAEPTNIWFGGAASNSTDFEWPRFGGTFDGQGYTISGIYNKGYIKNGASAYTTGNNACFGTTVGATTFKNVTFKNCYMLSGDQSGFLVNYANANLTVTGVTFDSCKVESTGNAGFVVARVNADTCTVTNTTATNCTLVASGSSGLLIGRVNTKENNKVTAVITNPTLTNNTMTFSGNCCGGIVGQIVSPSNTNSSVIVTIDGALVKDCTINANVNGRTGAIIGQAGTSGNMTTAATVTVKNSKVIGGVLNDCSTANYQGGGTIIAIAHTCNATVENVYSSMNIKNTGGSDTNTTLLAIGGFTGAVWNASVLTIKNSVYAGTITMSGKYRVAAGFVGYVTKGTFNADHCVFQGTINGTNAVYGAIFGRADSGSPATLNIQNCVNDGTITTWNCSGIIGQCYDGTSTAHNVTVKNNFSLKADAPHFSLGNTSSVNNYVKSTVVAEYTPNALYTNNMDGFSIVDGKVYPSAMAMELENAPVDFVGYQTKAGTSTVDVRLVGTVDDLWYDAVGFDVTLTLNDTTKTVSQNVTNVYSSIIAEGEGDQRDVLTATTLGGAYLFALNLTNLPNDADLTITVTPYFVRNGVKVAGNAVTLTGVNTAKNSVNG